MLENVSLDMTRKPHPRNLNSMAALTRLELMTPPVDSPARMGQTSEFFCARGMEFMGGGFVVTFSGDQEPVTGTLKDGGPVLNHPYNHCLSQGGKLYNLLFQSKTFILVIISIPDESCIKKQVQDLSEDRVLRLVHLVFDFSDMDTG